MTATPEISIIVPVYKVEKYLRETLDSILAQTFTSWECILVDDGSPDACGTICDEYAAADPRFRVIHRTNGGLSAARNSGIGDCRAPFVTFVDSDDVLRPEYLARLYELITTHNTDMAVVGLGKLYRNGCIDLHPVDCVMPLNRKELIHELMLSKKLPNYVCSKIFRRDVIGPDFPEGNAFEDIYVFSKWMHRIKNAVLAPEPLYLYRQRRGSLAHVGSLRNKMDYLNAVFTRLKEFSEIEPEVVNAERVEKEKWLELVKCAKSIARGFNARAERIANILKISELAKTLPKPRRSLLGMKTWRRAMLLLHAPRLFATEARLAVTINRHRRYRNTQFFD